MSKLKLQLPISCNQFAPIFILPYPQLIAMENAFLGIAALDGFLEMNSCCWSKTPDPIFKINVETAAFANTFLSRACRSRQAQRLDLMGSNLPGFKNLPGLIFELRRSQNLGANFSDNHHLSKISSKYIFRLQKTVNFSSKYN